MADVASSSAMGESSSVASSFSGKLSLKRLIALVKERNSAAVSSALSKEQEERKRKLLRRRIQWERRTLLHLAAVNRDTEMCRVLLENGSDPNLRDCLGQTPLCAMFQPPRMHGLPRSRVKEEVVKGETEDTDDITQLLIDYGIDVNEVADYHNGMSTVSKIALRGHSRALEKLLKHGADPNQTDSFGRTALFLVSASFILSTKQKGKVKEDIIELLLQYKADPCIPAKLHCFPKLHNPWCRSLCPFGMSPFLAALLTKRSIQIATLRKLFRFKICSDLVRSAETVLENCHRRSHWEQLILFFQTGLMYHYLHGTISPPEFIKDGPSTSREVIRDPSFPFTALVKSSGPSTSWGSSGASSSMRPSVGLTQEQILYQLLIDITPASYSTLFDALPAGIQQRMMSLGHLSRCKVRHQLFLGKREFSDVQKAFSQCLPPRISEFILGKWYAPCLYINES